MILKKQEYPEAEERNHTIIILNNQGMVIHEQPRLEGGCDGLKVFGSKLVLVNQSANKITWYKLASKNPEIQRIFDNLK